MTTLAQLIEDTRHYLSPERRWQIDKLNGAIDADDAALTVTYGENVLAAGKRVSVDLEDMHVWAASGKTASAVQRGVAGTAATHADGSIVYVDAPFTPYEIARAINRKLLALPGEGVFAFPTVELTASAATADYDLDDAEDVIGVQAIEYKSPGLANDWMPLHKELWSANLTANTTDFPSGVAVSVTAGLYPGYPFRVRYRAGFSQLALTTAGLSSSVENTSGIDEYAVELLPLGAAILLTLGRPVERTASDAQGQTRRPQEVSTSDTRMAATPLQIEYQQALQRVKREQLRRYGP